MDATDVVVAHARGSLRFRSPVRVELLDLPPMAAVLQKFGVQLVGNTTQQIRCPVHDDRSPSARFYADDQSVHCWSCARSWNVLTLTMARLKYDRQQARDWLKTQFVLTERPHGEIVRDTLRSRVEVSVARVTAEIALVDGSIRALVSDPLLAVRYWTALDVLLAELTPQTAGVVQQKLKNLKGKLHG
jgi:hypothetical protein